MNVSKPPLSLNPFVIVWFIALGMHAALFAMPVPSPETPVVKKSFNMVPLSQKVPTPAAAPIPKTVAVRGKSSPALVAKTSSTPATVQTPVPETSPTPMASPSPVASPTPTASPTPAITPTPTPSPIASATPTATPDPLLGNISKVLGAEPSCQGKQDCWQVGETHWRKVVASIEQQLNHKGYSLAEVELGDENGLGVYEVSKQDKREFYLHVILTAQGTVYLLKPQLLSRQELEQLTLQS